MTGPPGPGPSTMPRKSVAVDTLGDNIYIQRILKEPSSGYLLSVPETQTTRGWAKARERQSFPPPSITSKLRVTEALFVYVYAHRLRPNVSCTTNRLSFSVMNFKLPAGGICATNI